MKKLVFALIVIVSSCSTSKKVSVLQTHTPFDEKTTVTVISASQKVPDNAKLVGSIKIGDSGFTTKCTYADVVNDATKQARAMGANLIQIIKHKEPNPLTSTCHRIECEVYRVE